MCASVHPSLSPSCLMIKIIVDLLCRVLVGFRRANPASVGLPHRPVHVAHVAADFTAVGARGRACSARCALAAVPDEEDAAHIGGSPQPATRALSASLSCCARSSISLSFGVHVFLSLTWMAVGPHPNAGVRSPSSHCCCSRWGPQRSSTRVCARVSACAAATVCSGECMFSPLSPPLLLLLLLHTIPFSHRLSFPWNMLVPWISQTMRCRAPPHAVSCSATGE